MDPVRLERLSTTRLGDLIRPAGFFKVKAGRLKNLLRWLRRHGGFDGLNQLPTDELRAELLSVSGIGPETADDILVYAFGRPVFVADAYARRIFRRFGLIPGGEGYEEIRSMVERAMPPDASRLGEMHALLVTHGKRYCRARPLCDACCLKRRCARRINDK